MYKRAFSVHLEDTDAASLVYYPRLFYWAQISYELFLKSKNLPLNNLLEKAPYLLPIAACEGSFLAPLRFGDDLEACMTLLRLGTTSFTLEHTFTKKKEESKKSAEGIQNIIMAKASVRHVCTDRNLNKMPIPEPLRSHLSTLEPTQ